MPRLLTVSNITGEDGFITVGLVKQAVHDEVGVPLDHIVVVFKGQLFLEDGESLHAAGGV